MRRIVFLLLTTLMGAVSPQATAVQEIISATTNVTGGVPSSAEGYTYENGQRQVTSFSTATNSYGVSSVADNVFVRRNSVNPNQSSVWYANSGTGTNLAGIHHDSYGPMLLANDLFSGSDNTFANTNSNTLTIGNIERLDFTWNSALTVNNALAFAIFERGAVGVHDSFAIAPILAVDGLGNPTAFGNLLKIAGGWGATNAVGDQEYRLFRYNNGNVIDTSTDSSAVATQGVGGLLITAADLGLAAGTQIFGYSLMAADVTATNSTQLMDWLNNTYYPTTTDATTGGGGIDLASMNGVAFAVIPEPGALFPLFVVGGLFAYHNFRRARRSRQSV